MTSQGQRFRRRALRRGYKVDEVDNFLDRVEATITGEPVDAPVSPQEVHDVLFRVRFGGYDEWQVDLHLDRVERQLTEAAQGPRELGSAMGPRGDFGPERMGPPPGRGPGPGGPGGPGHGQGIAALGAGPGRAPGPGGPGGGPGGHGHGPGPGGPGPGGPGPGGPGPGGPGHGPPGPRQGGHGQAGAPMPGPGGPPPPGYDREPGYDRGGYERGPGYEQFDEPTYGGYDGRPPARESGRAARGEDRYQADMTSEMRLGDPGGPPGPRPEPGHHGAGMAGAEGALPRRRPSSPPPGEMGGPGMAPPSPGMADPGFGYSAAPEQAPPPPPPASPELQRLDQLRRGFQPRRFGSGYDRGQVDQLFERVMAGVSGQGPMSVSDADLDPGRFDLVPGGYFEAEVDHALHEVRDILHRR